MCCFFTYFAQQQLILTHFARRVTNVKVILKVRFSGKVMNSGYFTCCGSLSSRSLKKYSLVLISCQANG